jgi:hypothetical protein
MKDLKPCPFCGSLPTRKVVHDRLSVECPNCVSVGFHNHVRLGCLADQQWDNRAKIETYLKLNKPVKEGRDEE